MKHESSNQEISSVRNEVAGKQVESVESMKASAYGLRIARELLINGNTLSERTDGAVMELILALPSPAKEKAFVDFCLTGEISEEVFTIGRELAAA